MPLKFGFKSRLFSRSCVDLSSTRARSRIDSSSVITVGFKGSQIALGTFSDNGGDEQKASKEEELVSSSKKENSKERSIHSSSLHSTSAIGTKKIKHHKFERLAEEKSHNGHRARPKGRVKSTGQLPMLQEDVCTSNGHINPEMHDRVNGQMQTCNLQDHSSLPFESSCPSKNSEQIVTSTTGQIEVSQPLTCNNDVNARLGLLSKRDERSLEGDSLNGHLQDHLSSINVRLVPEDLPLITSPLVSFTSDSAGANSLNAANVEEKRHTTCLNLNPILSLASTEPKRHTTCLNSSPVVNTATPESSKTAKKKSSNPLSVFSNRKPVRLIRRRSKGKPDVVHWKRKVCVC